MNRSMRVRLGELTVGGLLTFASVAPSFAASWQQTPLPFWHARVQEMAITPSQSGRVYICTAIGVFRSDDRGVHWTPVSDGLPAGASIEAIAVSPVDADRAWLLMTFSGHPYSTVSRTTNGGESWMVFSEVLPNWAEDLIVLSTNPTVLLAAASAPQTTPVHRSTDEGASWAPIGAGLSSHVKDLASRAADPSVVLAVHAGGVARSTDSGSTWTPGISYIGGLSEIAMSPSDPSRVYTSNEGLLLKSTDGGISFASIQGPFPPFVNGNIDLVAVHPSLPDEIQVAEGAATDACDLGFFTSTHKSTNGGLTWSPGYFECPEAGPNALLYDPTDPDHVYFGLLSGFYYSSSGGAPGTWARRVDGIANYWIVLVEGDLDGGNYVATGVGLPYTPRLLYRSLGDLSSWTHVSSTLKGFNNRFEVNFTNPNRMFEVGLFYDPDNPYETPYLRQSTDGGIQWATAGVAQGIPDDTEFKGIYSNHGNGTRVYALAWPGTLYRSTNGGQNYQVVRTGMEALTDLVVDPFVANRLFIAMSSGPAVQLSTDGGVTFVSRSSGLPAAPARALFMRRADHTALAVVFANGEVWETFDSGLTWSLRFDLDTPDVKDADWDEASGHVFLITHVNTVISSHPSYDPTDMPPGILSVRWDSAQSTLLAGTSVRGLWQQAIASQVDAPLVVDAAAFELEVAPNPARDATTLRFAVPAGGAQVTGDVFDATGRRIRRLVDAALPEGVRQLVWDGAAENGERASAGVYFVRVRAGGEESTARIVRLR